MSKTVFSSGEYDGRLIEDIVTLDPCYVVWAYSNLPALGISEHDYNEARRIMDEWDGGNDPYEDFNFAEQQAREFGWEPGYD